MTFAFTFPFPVQPKSTDGAALARLGKFSNLTQKDLEDRGVVLSSQQMKEEYLFSPMGGWNVVFRSSVIRVRAAPILP